MEKLIRKYDKKNEKFQKNSPHYEFFQRRDRKALHDFQIVHKCAPSREIILGRNFTFYEKLPQNKNSGGMSNLKYL